MKNKITATTPNTITILITTRSTKTIHKLNESFSGGCEKNPSDCFLSHRYSCQVDRAWNLFGKLHCPCFFFRTKVFQWLVFGYKALRCIVLLLASNHHLIRVFFLNIFWNQWLTDNDLPNSKDAFSCACQKYIELYPTIPTLLLLTMNFRYNECVLTQGIILRKNTVFSLRE